ncbi:unnamed protein product [Porites evermanni]|uniref:Uncharacterized protein n=1 Tax=Porites evermanni TaxID=104178 RepID=A0ABN8SJI7_9CNID|nr:unnamed protein product [Porites evermanni]
MDTCVKRVAILMVFTSVVLFQGAASDQNVTQPTSKVNATMTPTQPPTTNKPSGNESFNETVTSSTPTSESVESVKQPDTHGLLQRSLYVAVGISALVVIYFIVRAVKTRGRRKAKKYGVIHGTGSAELQPLDKATEEEEEEEDMTLFDRKDTKWPR